MANDGWRAIGPSRMVGKRRVVDAECGCGRRGLITADVNGRLKSEYCNACKGKRLLRHGHARWRAMSPTYRIWLGMRDRCTNAKATAFANYGGRGIKVCSRWQEFSNFLADMGERPANRSLDRIDNDGNYDPGNCRWATRTEQNSNSRNCHPLTWQGRTQTTAAWARELGVSKGALRQRIHDGWSDAEALSTPFGSIVETRRHRQNYETLTHNGETLTHWQWAERTGIGRTTIRERVRLGWSPEKALTTPVRTKRA